MKLSAGDWIKAVAMLGSATVLVVGLITATSHDIESNSEDVVRLEAVDVKHESRIEKLEDKTANIDKMLVKISTEQTANSRMLEKLDEKMDEVLSK